jgi:predicted lipoprotein with Yx(FWY)xxD motif
MSPRLNQLGSRATWFATAGAVALILAACGSSSGPGKTSSASTSSRAPTAPAGVTISTSRGPQGAYLTGASGRALYLWVGDSDGASNCSGDCASAWPPVIGRTTAASGGAIKSALGTIIRSDGTEQVSYHGHPLYYSTADPGPGTTHAEGSDSFGASWWLVAPSGAAITTKGGSATAPSLGY